MKEQIIEEEKQEKLIMKENYDGYRFSLHGKEKIYNSNMCLYFLNSCISLKRMPEQIIDVNIASFTHKQYTCYPIKRSLLIVRLFSYNSSFANCFARDEINCQRLL